MRRLMVSCVAMCIATVPAAAQQPQAWLNPALGADQRADLTVAQMTRDEKLTLVFGYIVIDADWKSNRRLRPKRESRASTSTDRELVQ